MARAGSKRQIAIDIMNANSEKPMSVVLPLIAEANGFSLGAARGYYVYLAQNGFATGTPETGRRGRQPSAPKAPKVSALSVDEAPAPKLKVKKETKSASDVATIKAENLRRLKEVSKKLKTTKVDAETTTPDGDSFSAPAFLTKDQMEALV